MKTTSTSLFCLGTLLALLCCLDTAQAQTTTLSANPLQITFNTQPGVTPPPQTLLISSSNGQVNATAATTNNPWLFISPLGGATPLSITVSVGQGAPSSGTDVGFINISAPGAAVLSVQVTLNVNSGGGASPLIINPNSLSFPFAANSTVPVTKSVSLSSSDPSVSSFSTTVTTNNTGNWVTVGPSSGSLPNTLQVTVNPSALSGPGPFNAAIAISAPGTTGVSLPVLVTVGGTPSIRVDPVQFSFAFQLGASPPAPQTLSITSSTGANVGFTATPKTFSCGNGWLVLTQQNGATPGSIGVQVNTSGLQAGNCAGEIDISAPGASNPNVVVPVSVLVSANPLLQVPSTGPTFTYQIGGNTQLATQNVQITSSTPGVSFTAAATLVSGPNFLSVTPSSGVTPQSLALTVNSAVLASLGPGTYSENVTITASGAGNSPQSFAVTLIVSSNPILISNVTALNFNYQVNLTPPQSQIVTLTSTGAPLNFQVAANTTNCPGFLLPPPSTGVTFGSQNQVLVSVNVAGLTTSQTCTGNITLTVPGSSDQLVIPVTLTVSTTALLNVSQPSINVSALVGANTPTTQLVSVTSTDPNNQLSFFATAATNPTGLTWLAITPNSGNTPNNLQITINPANLQPGTYTGAITVSANNVPSQVIPVTLTLYSSSIGAAPANLAFAQSFGGPQPASQTTQISGVPAGTTVGVVTSLLSGAGWLNASVSGNAVAVTVNGSALGQGTYLGVVTAIVPGAQNSPLYVPVTLTIGPTQSLSVSPSQLGFTFQAGSSTTPFPQTVQVTSSGGSVPITAVFNPVTGGNFVTVASSSASTPATLTVTLNASVASTLPLGSYSGNVVVSSTSLPGGSQTISVRLTVTAAAPPVIMAITSGASFAPGPVSPGLLVSIFGAQLGPTPGVGFTPDNGRVDTTLAGTMVMFDNVQAPLIYVSAGQINAIVPYEVGSNTFTNITVIRGGVSSTSLPVTVAATVPAIFSALQTGNGQGAILNQNLSPNSANNPAPKGSIISIYATGEGALMPTTQTGTISGPSLPLPKPIASVTVTIGGQPATVTYAGEAPSLVSGVLQVNCIVPTNIASGNQLVVLNVGNNTNTLQSITAAIQ